MQTSRVPLSLPGSITGSLVASSRASSAASSARAGGDGEELENYLSLVAGDREKKRSKHRDRQTIDWSSLLENRDEELKTIRDEEVVIETNDDIFHFLKPKSLPANKEKSELTIGEKGNNGARKIPTKTSNVHNVSVQRHSHPMNLRDSLSMTDTTMSESESKSEALINTLHMTQETSRKPTQPTAQIRADIGSKMDGKRQGMLNSAGRGARTTSVDYSLSFEEDTDDVSLAQDLALSSHFRNNIFSIDELQPANKTHKHTSNSNIEDTTPEEENSVVEYSTGLGQLHNIVSLADLDSVPAESRTDILPKDTKVNAVEESIWQKKDFERDRKSVDLPENAKRSLAHTFSGNPKQEKEIETEGGRTVEDLDNGSQVLIEEGEKEEVADDFGDRSVMKWKSYVSSQASLVMEQTVSVDSAEGEEDYSLQWEDEEVEEEDEEVEEVEEEEVVDDEEEEELEEEKEVMEKASNNGSINAIGSSEIQAPVNDTASQGNDGTPHFHIPTGSYDTCSANSIKPEQSTSKSKQYEASSNSLHPQSGPNGAGSLSPPLILPEFPPSPHFSSLLPHLCTTHSITTTRMMSEVQEELIRSQLELTRTLVTRSRSLAQYMTDSITSDYHYTTLEDTKTYISRHRPRVLTTKEAQRLVSKEDNNSTS